MKKSIPALGALLLLTLTTTYPLILRFGKFIPGFFSTDESYAILWDSWRIKYCFWHGLSLRYTDFIAYPFGTDLYNSGYISYLQQAVIHFLSILTTPALTYNIQVITNIFLSACFVFFLVFYLSKSRISAFFSGIIFAFCPYQFARSWQHLGLTYNQWLPLCIMAAILLKEKGGRKEFIFFLISVVLLLSFDFSVMYFGVMILLVFFVFVAVYKGKTDTKEKFIFLKKAASGMAIALTALLPQFLPLIKRSIAAAHTPASVFNAYNRPFENLFSQSAKVLSYLLPSVTHPLFGRFTEQFIGSPLYGESFTEHALYLGWIPLSLAFIAIQGWRKRNKGFSGKEGFYISFFIFLAVCGWLFSQPPWWKLGPLKIYMPSFFMYKLLPMYRAYCRFAIVVMLAVAVLAGFGLKFMLEKYKSGLMKTLISSFCCIVVLFEFWNWPPYKVIDIAKVPAVYDWLHQEKGDFAVAEYPLDYDGANEIYKLFQTEHGKKIINGTVPGTYANNVAHTIKKLSDPKTAHVLKRMGVKYAVVHKDVYFHSGLIEQIEEMQNIPKNPNLKLVKSFPAQECPDRSIMCVQKAGPIDVYLVSVSFEPAIK